MPLHIPSPSRFLLVYTVQSFDQFWFAGSFGAVESGDPEWTMDRQRFMHSSVLNHCKDSEIYELMQGWRWAGTVRNTVFFSCSSEEAKMIDTYLTNFCSLIWHCGLSWGYITNPVYYQLSSEVQFKGELKATKRVINVRTASLEHLNVADGPHLIRYHVEE